MRKKNIISLVLLVILGASVFTFISFSKKKGNDEELLTSLLPRKNSLAYSSEWPVVKNNAEILMAKVTKDPTDKKSLLELTALYIQEGRNTGNFSYYNNAALKCIDAVLKVENENFEALSFKSSILLSQHHFEGGLALAEKARQLYPQNAFVYGLLIDGNIEMGNYETALAAAEKMISIRPDIRSYSRIAYLREIFGDIPGAIEAMKLAVDAGSTGDENTEWCRVQLGMLYEKTGKILEAKMQYTIAETNRNNYPYALAGLARIAIEEMKFEEAKMLYLKADSIIPDHMFKEGLAEVYTITGEEIKSKEIAHDILEYVTELSSVSNTKNDEGQNEDHEMAHACMGVGDYSRALKFAMKEYNRRPLNIEVNETVAIILLQLGEPGKAVSYITRALKTDCKNPELLSHAALIYAEAGDTINARRYYQEAFKNKPVLSKTLQLEINAKMKEIGLAHQSHLNM